MLPEALEKLEGVTCGPIRAGLWAFPKITLPHKFLDVCAQRGLVADAVYVQELLEATGVCVLPGSALGHAPHTYTSQPSPSVSSSASHLSSTCASSSYHICLGLQVHSEENERLVSKWAIFHRQFMEKYRYQHHHYARKDQGSSDILTHYHAQLTRQVATGGSATTRTGGTDIVSAAAAAGTSATATLQGNVRPSVEKGSSDVLAHYRSQLSRNVKNK